MKNELMIELPQGGHAFLVHPVKDLETSVGVRGDLEVPLHQVAEGWVVFVKGYVVDDEARLPHCRVNPKLSGLKGGNDKFNLI